MNKDFSLYLRMRFPAYKVQKISIDAGFTCPNRDGSKGVGGCIYCNNVTFVPTYITSEKGTDICSQLKEGIRFFSRKYKSLKYIAYFQAYTNTYAPLDILRKLYEEALSVDGVVGIIIGTRPDCVSEAILDYIQGLSQRVFVMLEYGVESAWDVTLRIINRCHTYAEAEDAIRRTAARKIPVGAHVILGLPGETLGMMLETADKLSELPLTSVKLHQLQLVRGATPIEDYPTSVKLFTVEEYLDVITKFLSRLRDDIYIDRFVSQSLPELVIAPDWGIKNHEFKALLYKKLKQ